MYLNRELSKQQDNIYVPVTIKPLEEITGMPTTSRFSQAVIADGNIVNVVSPRYALLDNRDFFGKVEHQLIEEGIEYKQRTYNRNNGSFSVDYVLDDPSKVVTLKKGVQAGIDDTIVPMLRFTNSYDGTVKTSGHLGFFRKICNNGLHITQCEIDFTLKHTKNNMAMFIPSIDDLVKRFMDNEMYSITNKIDVMQSKLFYDTDELKDFVKQVADETGVFQYQISDENPLPSLNARTVLDIINREAEDLKAEQSAWLVYNGFNELIHGKLKKNFTQQRDLDQKVFDTVFELVEA